MVVPPIFPHQVTKDALRQSLRQRRRDYVRSLTAAERARLDASLADQVCAHLSPGTLIGSYVAIGSEIAPLPTDHRAAAVGCEIAYPWFADREADMCFRRGGKFVPGPFNFPQPDPDATLVQPDVLLVPLLGVDRSGNRIGQGAGHYDRYIANQGVNKSIVIIGLSYDIQIIDELLPDPWDRPMHAIATPHQWIDISG